MEINLYATLRDVVGGPKVRLEGISEIRIDQLLEELYRRYPGLRSQLVDKQGQLHSAIHILINGRDMRYLDGLETVVTGKDEVRIFPPVGGGAK